jgi:hypothetical protein
MTPNLTRDLYDCFQLTKFNAGDSRSTVLNLALWFGVHTYFLFTLCSSLTLFFLAVLGGAIIGGPATH